MEQTIGDFVTKNSPLFSVAVEDNELSDEARDELREIYDINYYRTIDQDAQFGIRQLVDIAMKALSPGVNDTTTAIFCVDYLGAILEQVANRRIESPYRMDGERGRVITKSQTFAGMVATAFDQIRINSEGNAALLERMLKSLTNIAAQTKSTRRKQILLQQVHLIAEQADRTLQTSYERAQVREHLVQALQALDTEEAHEHILKLLDERAKKDTGD